MGRKNKLDPEIAARTGIKPENPEKYYKMAPTKEVDEAETTVGEGKFARVVHAESLADGKKYAAKCIKYDKETLKFALREYDTMMDEKFQHKCMAKLHEAYIVQKYLILIMDLVDGKTILEWAVAKARATSLSEDDVANIVKQMLDYFQTIHQNNYTHLDIRPTNIRMEKDSLFDMKILDYNSCKHVPNKKAGAVVDVIGDTEFCGPEMLNFEPISWASDMWSLGIHCYILLSGTSPYFDEAGEDETCNAVRNVKFVAGVDEDFVGSSKALKFCKDIFKKPPDGPTGRLTVADAFTHEWLSDDYASARKNIKLTDEVIDRLDTTDKRLKEEEEEDYVIGSFVFRTFEEDEYESPDEDEDEE